MSSKTSHGSARLQLLVLLVVLAGYALALAQPRSKIVGSVKDAVTGEGLVGVNIVIGNTTLGAATDLNGRYFIIGVAVGTYEVRASMIGYSPQVVRDVIVSADRIATVDFLLRPSTIEMKEVVVEARKNDLHREVSNTQTVVTDQQIIDAAGIREINAFLQKLPGTSTDNDFIAIRGGSADQTGTMVNGMSYNNAIVGNAETSIPLSAIDQVSLLSGGFNAEYGNFRSGLINVTTKAGSKNGYHGTFMLSRNSSTIKRFGSSFYDTRNPVLRPFLDPEVAFIGTAEAWKDDPYARQQHNSFDGWNNVAQSFNIGKAPGDQATPLDFYLLAAWLHTAIPDYSGLAKLGYTVPEEQQRLFAQHAMKEGGVDVNFDGGFGGPIPIVSASLGDATFYISNNSMERHYIMPVTRPTEELHTTFATIKSNPHPTLTITLNGLWKRQIGVSPIVPPNGDFPNAANYGGFTPLDNIRYFARDPDYWFDPPLQPLYDQTTLMGGITINHLISKSTYWELSFSALSIRDGSPTGFNRDLTAITHFGPFVVDEMPYGKFLWGTHRVTGIFGNDTLSYRYPSYDAIPGVPRRFRGKEGDLYTNVRTKQYQAKASMTSQLDERHFLKAGVEYNSIDIDHNLWMMWNDNAYNTYEFNFHRRPSQTGVYVQDQIMYEGIVANIGLRMDYYYGGGGKWPSGDPFAVGAFVPVYVDTSLYSLLRSGRSLIWELWEDYDRQHPGFLKPIPNYLTFSPRLGVSFPVTERSKFYFNYGHFRSNPPYYSMYMYRYRYTKNGLYDMSNPNLEPPRTISYELGVAYNFYQNYIVTVSGYSKDVTGQQGDVTYQSADGTLTYDTWANNNYEDVRGLEINLTKNDNSWLTGWVNFNYMLRKSGLTGRSLITDLTINDDREGLYAAQETRTLPIPMVNANITFRAPQVSDASLLSELLLSNWVVTVFGEWRAGDYFSWNPLGKPHLNNNLQWPDYSMVDLKVTKGFKVFGVTTTLFLDINNVFNFKVNLLNRGWAFDRRTPDRDKYLASLQLPMYDSPEFDQLRAANPGSYLPGSDQPGDVRSSEKDYINDPNYSFWAYGKPRDIWFGVRVDF